MGVKQHAAKVTSAEPTQKSQRSAASIVNTQRSVTKSASQPTQKSQRSTANSTQASKEDAKPRKIDREFVAKATGRKTSSGSVEKTQPSMAGGLSRRRELEHDKTQWENTRFKELHVKLQQGVDPNENQNNLKIDEIAALQPDTKSLGTNVPGETRQETKEQGEHLLLFPTFSVVFDFIELGCLFFALIMTCVGSQMVVLGGYVAMLNIVICIGMLGFTLYSQWTHRQVDEETTPEGHHVYKTKALYKKLFFFFHIVRMWLSFSSMVILFYHSSCDKLSESLEGAGEAAVAVTQCREPESSSPFYIAAGCAMIFPIALSIMHLVFICKNQFARKAFK